METTPSIACHVFGPFEVNAATGELRRSGLPVRLARQPFLILLALLAQPGTLITREQLRAELWAGTTFIDFDQGLNAAVNRLRRALGDSAENPRYIETDPGHGYRFVGTLKTNSGDHQIAAPAAAPATATNAETPVRPARFRWGWVVGGVALCAASLVVGWRFHQAPPSSAPWKLAQLTSDVGVSDSPAISPDGKFVAYSSDRLQPGARDLFVKQISGGEPIRLTFDGAGNTTPDFSPDGSRIIFRSARDGGGIYEIPALGGEQRLLVRGGLNPRYSPDGSQVAYWAGAPNVAVAIPGSGAVWVMPADGGRPRQLAASLTNARYPIWAPDGKHLLMVGYSSNTPYDASAVDWWFVSLNGDTRAASGLFDVLARAGLQRRAGDRSNPTPAPSVPYPNCWIAGSNTIIFSNQGGDTTNLWEASISPATGKISGTPRRLTTGSGNEVSPSCSTADNLIFTDQIAERDLWSVPFDLDRGVARGTLTRVTDGHDWREHASLSKDGRFIAFASTQSGPLNIWVRNLATREETHVDPSPLAQRFPVINADGSRVAYSLYEENKRTVIVKSLGGVSEKVCDSCLRATDWSKDGKTLLTFGGSPEAIDLVDVATHRRTPLVHHPAFNVLYARYSPDNRWISFTARTQPDRSEIVIAPFDGPKPIVESAWIKIADEGAEDWVNWSPDGRTLYFTSNRDGHYCLWAQRLDPASHRPAGAAFAVQHFHGRQSYRQGGWSAAGGRIAVVLYEGTSNVWSMSRAHTR